MSIYPSLAKLKLDEFIAQHKMCTQHLPNFDIQSLRTLYPILDDYSDLELSDLAQKNSIAMSWQQLSERATNGVQKLMMRQDFKDPVTLKLSKYNQGIFVRSIKRHSPADKAGLRFGHQILQINNTLVTGLSLTAVIKIFQESSFNYNNVIIRDRPLEQSINLHKDLSENVGFQFKNGVIIDVDKDSSAALNGLLTNHQLLEVNGKSVFDLEDKQIENIFTNSTDMITITTIPESIYNHMIKKIAPSLDLRTVRRIIK